MTRWGEHFESLLNRSPPIEPPEILPARNDLDINCEPPTLEEIEKAVSLLNSNKAAGPDYIPPEALKADSKVSSTILHGLFEKIWTEEKYPNDWKEVDWLMKESTSGSTNGIQWTLWTQLDDLDFADDIALVSHNHSQMQDKTSTVNQLSGSIGLRIHPGKSKMLKIKTEDTQAKAVGGKPLKVVEKFMYLGSVIDHSGGTAGEGRSRVAKARAAFKTLDKIWRDRTISTKTKIRLFNSNVKSALLYGCETWSLNQSSLKKVQTFVNRDLRRILRIFWPERIRNEELWNRARQRPIREEITQRRWRWLGRTLRKPRKSITRQSLQWNAQGKRSRGRPRTKWRRNLEEEMKASGNSWRDITRMAQDRREWGTVVRGLYPLQGPKSHSQGKESWQGAPHAVEGWPVQGSSSRPWLPGPGSLPVPADASLAPALAHC
ncbi:hypothetical protein RRG08_059696 [Elysia crispata]|uniref:DUF6451 domain-containing protein n=1 Tax=Elysia crispata TaxID=231223 RepID=A0AAE0ZKE1_9GAST|nr:hypothetical protein RRG08_059696 [Elysia crispata]